MLCYINSEWNYSTWGWRQNTRDWSFNWVLLQNWLSCQSLSSPVWGLPSPRGSGQRLHLLPLVLERSQKGQRDFLIVQDFCRSCHFYFLLQKPQTNWSAFFDLWGVGERFSGEEGASHHFVQGESKKENLLATSTISTKRAGSHTQKGYSMNSPAVAADWFREMFSRLLRRSSILQVFHLTKGRERRGPFSLYTVEDFCRSLFHFFCKTHHKVRRGSLTPSLHFLCMLGENKLETITVQICL